jgi:hypothetical protein
MIDINIFKVHSFRCDANKYTYKKQSGDAPSPFRITFDVSIREQYIPNGI